MEDIMPGLINNTGAAAPGTESAAGVSAKTQGSAAPGTDTDDINITGADLDDEEFDDIDDTDDADEDDTDDDTDDGSEDDEDDDDNGKPADKGQKQTVKPDQNAAFAEVRRKAEAEAKIKATQEAQRMAAAEVDKAFADMGLEDPSTKKPIKTKAEYDAYKARHATEVAAKEFGKAGISVDTLNSLIENHPMVQQAKQAVAGYEEAQRQVQESAARVRLDEQIKEITALDPSIKTVDDLAAQPYYEQLRGYVKKGLTIVEAFKLTNIDKLNNKTASAAAQSAYNKAQSKEHLTSSAARGQGEVVVPKAVMNNYRKLCPNMTAKEIRADYAKFQKKYS
jgi:hypothetical protein